MALNVELKDLAEQGYAYHIASITDLRKTLKEGIRFNDKSTYFSKYYELHSYIDSFKPEFIPEWVERKKAIFGSISFRKDHIWHSHSAVLKVRIDTERCWVCNENIANFIYEPLILQNLEGFDAVRRYMQEYGKSLVEQYWYTSLSFNENLKKRHDKRGGYDAEILILHDIPPKDIECLYIVSDHEIMNFEEWKTVFRPDCSCPVNYVSKYLQHCRTCSAWNMSGSQ